MLIKKDQYIEYLISTPVNYTASNLAAHLDQISHDAVSDFLARQRITARELYGLVSPLLNVINESWSDSHKLADSYH